MSKSEEDKKEYERLKQGVKDSQKAPLPCTLCFSETLGRGVFTTEQKGVLGAPKDSFRVVIYPLCFNCSLIPNYQEFVKRKIYSEYN